MGRLAHLKCRLGRYSWKVLTGFAVTTTLVIALGIFSLLSHQRDNRLEIYLQHQTPPVGSDTKGGYQQAFFYFEGRKEYISSSKTNQLNPRSDGHYVVWSEQSVSVDQPIIRYDLLRKTKITIVQTGANYNPTIYQGRVAWERYDYDREQIFYFDGTTTRRITSGDTSVRPALNGSQLAYAVHTKAGEWQVIEQDLNGGETLIVNTSQDSSKAYPRYVSGKLITDINQR